MFNHLQKFPLILSFYVISLIAMESGGDIIPAIKTIFTPTDANNKLSDIVKNAFMDSNGNWKSKVSLCEKTLKDIETCLEKKVDPNSTFGYTKTPFFSLAVIHQIKPLCDLLLRYGANINASDIYKRTPLHILMYYFKNSPHIIHTIKFKYNDSVKFLIQHKANINQKDNNCAPLGIAINYNSEAFIEIIEQLCEAGALPTNIDNDNSTVFHLAAEKREKIIKTLITHINFKNDSNATTNTIKTALLLFNRLKNPDENMNIRFDIPHEIQILILSNLLSPNFFHKGLYKTLVNKGYYHLPRKLVNEHVQLLKEILQIKNKNNKTAWELAPKAHLYARKTNIELLVDGTTLQKYLDILNEHYPNDLSAISETNLALQIFEKHYNKQTQKK